MSQSHRPFFQLCSLPWGRSHGSSRLLFPTNARTSTCAGLLLVAFTGYTGLMEPPLASPRNRFDNCTRDLISRQIAPEAATAACSKALQPEDLRVCVVDIAKRTTLPAGDILSACQQVRRPKAMAKCVVKLRQDVKGATEAEILDNCSRTLFPERYSFCVRGLSRASSIGASAILNSCNDGGAQPRQLAPTFIPYQLPPSEQLQDGTQQTPSAPVQPSPMVPAPTQPAQPSPTLPQQF